MSWKRIAPALVGIVFLVLAGCRPSGPAHLKVADRSLGTNAPVPEDQAQARDWPQWRHDACRSAHSPAELPPSLHLQWVREFSPRAQVWDDPLNHDLMTYDKVFEPIVLGDRMFVGFNDRDKVVALDIHTGRELWTFFTDGPVRLPPAGWEDKVYFVSDDGYLYCVNAGDGSLAWKFLGGPSERKVLGNGRVVSAWPARGGPVIRDGRVYFAASIWPFMGTYLYALDARTGKVVWVNDGTGAQYMRQPHSAPAFAGVAPQGALVATRDLLLVPGGRSVPAAFDRATGRFRYFRLDESGKGTGGSFVVSSESEFFVHTRLRGTRVHELKTGNRGEFIINEPVLTTNRFFAVRGGSSLRAAVLEGELKLAAARQMEADALADASKAEEENDKGAYKNATNSLASARRKIGRAEAEITKATQALGTNWAGGVVLAFGMDKQVRWELPAAGAVDIIKAGQRLYAGGTNQIVTVELLTNKLARLAATNMVEGVVHRLLAASGLLFAVTLDGRIMAFGAQAGTPEALPERFVTHAPPPGITEQAAAMLDQAGAREGWALCFGVNDPAPLQALALQSRLQVVGVDPDGTKIELFRRRLDAAGLYGTRVSLHAGDPASFKAPPYLASLIVMGDSMAARMTEPPLLKVVFESLRPYGGTLWVPAPPGKADAMAARVKRAAPAAAKVLPISGGVMVVRDGPLPGSGEWTHQYGDIANTLKSDDKLAKLPLGLLWFGGPTHADVLPRHGHGPSAQVAGGRLFIEGMDCLSARDVYTGRVLWKSEFEDLGNFGVYFDRSYTNAPLTTAFNQKHIPGSNARGANFVATATEVYLVASNACRVLDARTGKVLRRIELAPAAGEIDPPQWGFLGIYEELLLAGEGFAHYSRRLDLGITNKATPILDLSASRGLLAFNRMTGERLWRVEARHSFPHNAIVAGGGRVYCLDRLPKGMRDKLKRRGQTLPSDYRIVALDARSGAVVWESQTNVFGTWLGYSKEHDILLQAGASNTDRLKEEADTGMLAYRGARGTELWKKLDVKYNGPCVLYHDMILTTPAGYKTNSGAFSLLDGTPRRLANPLTGEAQPWRIYRTYGCGHPIACENLMTFRSGAAGFYDLENHNGTGNFGGFKSSCSPNLIVADGVLNAPDYTRTCSCPYQNQTSLAFVHWPDLEMWTHNQYGAAATNGTRIHRLGINFGAPGDRRSETGTLWMDFPNVSGTSPNLMVAVSGTQTNYFRRHASQMDGAGPAWVMASGVCNAQTILIAPDTRKPGPPPAPPKRTSDDDDEDYEENGNGTNEVSKAETNGTNGTAQTGLTQTNKTPSSQKPPLAAAAYTVRLYFAEPEDLLPGERVFDVALQRKAVLKNFDIVARTGRPLRGLVREFNRVMVRGALEITLARAKDAKYGPVLCGVEMILEEGKR